MISLIDHVLVYRLGRVAHSVVCIATDACLTADPGVASLISARSHTFVEIDHEIISTVILLPSAESFKKGCCQLQAKVCPWSTGQLLVQACPGKSVVRRSDRSSMTIAVVLGHKATKQTKTRWVSYDIKFTRQGFENAWWIATLAERFNMHSRSWAW